MKIRRQKKSTTNDDFFLWSLLCFHLDRLSMPSKDQNTREKKQHISYVNQMRCKKIGVGISTTIKKTVNIWSLGSCVCVCGAVHSWMTYISLWLFRWCFYDKNPPPPPMPNGISCRHSTLSICMCVYWLCSTTTITIIESPTTITVITNKHRCKPASKWTNQRVWVSEWVLLCILYVYV